MVSYGQFVYHDLVVVYSIYPFFEAWGGGSFLLSKAVCFVIDFFDVTGFVVTLLYYLS